MPAIFSIEIKRNIHQRGIRLYHSSKQDNWLIDIVIVYNAVTGPWIQGLRYTLVENERNILERNCEFRNHG